MKEQIKKFMLKVPKMIRNFLMEDVNTKIENLDKTVKRLDSKIDRNTVDDIRGEIVNFSEDLRQGAHKSKVQFQHIFEIYDKYHKMGYNSYITHEFQYINQKFNEIHNK